MITLNANQVTEILVGGVATETNSQAAVQGHTIDLTNNFLIVTLSKGSISGNAVTVGSAPNSQTTIGINLTTGAWQSPYGPFSPSLAGTLAPADLTSLSDIFKSLRNALETFAVNQNILPGIQVPWV